MDHDATTRPGRPATERDLVRWLAEHVPTGPGVLLGIGDDAAVIDAQGRGPLVFACDQTVESVHFLRSTATLAQVGHKAIARNLSDLAAMGARPWVALCSAALPRGFGFDEFVELFEGMLATARREEITLVGGDLCRVDERLSIDVSVIGVLEGRSALTRGGARPGDELFVTGELGASLEGHHLRFTPRWREALRLASTGRVTACMDVSDGLVIDLLRMMEASRACARLVAERIPRRRLQSGPPCALERALHDGEDFELLIAASAGSGEVLRAALGDAVPLSCIGSVVIEDHAPRVSIETGGTLQPLECRGHEYRFGA